MSKHHCTIKKCVCIKVQEDRSEEPKMQRRRVLLHVCTHTGSGPRKLVEGASERSASSSLTLACVSFTDCQSSSNNIVCRAVKLLPTAPFPWWLILLHHFEECTVSCSDRRERAEGWGTITAWTPLSLHGSRPRKLSRWCVSSVRLRARWGGAGGLELAWVRVNLEVEGGGRCLGGVVTALLQRCERQGGCERQKRWMDGWWCWMNGWWMDEGTVTERNKALEVKDFK